MAIPGKPMRKSRADVRNNAILNYALREARCDKDLRMNDLAGEVGVSARAIRNYEHLDDNPSDRVAEAIARVLDKGVEYLFPYALRRIAQERRKARYQRSKNGKG
ncbi:MAG: helix-turn-helix transcriptional regulator [archaeon]